MRGGELLPSSVQLEIWGQNLTSGGGFTNVCKPAIKRKRCGGKMKYTCI